MRALRAELPDGRWLEISYVPGFMWPYLLESSRNHRGEHNVGPAHRLPQHYRTLATAKRKASEYAGQSLKDSWRPV